MHRVQRYTPCRYLASDERRSIPQPPGRRLACRAAPWRCCRPRRRQSCRRRGDLSPRLAELAEPAVRSRLAGRAGGALEPRRRGARAACCATATGSSSKSASTAARAAAVDALRAAGARDRPRQPPLPDGHGRGPARRPARASARSPASSGVTEVLTPLGLAAPTAAARCTSEGDAQLARRRRPRRLRRRRQRGRPSASSPTPSTATRRPPTRRRAGRRQRRPARARQPLRRHRRRSASSTTATPAKPATRAGRWPRSSTTWRPGASISFATAFTGELGFAANIRALAAAGAKVIVDDVAYFEEPFFQDGPIAVAIDDVAAAGVAYFSAAGNDNLIDAGGNDIASWEAPEFRDCRRLPAPARSRRRPVQRRPLHGLRSRRRRADDTFGITVEAGEDADRRPAVGGTLERGQNRPRRLPARLEREPLVDRGRRSVASTDDNVGDSQRPVEFFSWENEPAPAPKCSWRSTAASTLQPELTRTAAQVHPAPERRRGERDRVPGISRRRRGRPDDLRPRRRRRRRSPSAPSATTTPPSPEPFSSRGPVTHYFGPVDRQRRRRRADSPAGIAKPDIAATDCGRNTFFGLPGRRLALLRHLGRGAPRGRGRRAGAAGEPGPDPGADPRRAGRDAPGRSAPSARTRSAPA